MKNPPYVRPSKRRATEAGLKVVYKTHVKVERIAPAPAAEKAIRQRREDTIPSINSGLLGKALHFLRMTPSQLGDICDIDGSSVVDAIRRGQVQSQDEVSRAVLREVDNTIGRLYAVQDEMRKVLREDELRRLTTR